MFFNVQSPNHQKHLKAQLKGFLPKMLNKLFVQAFVRHL